MRYQEIGAFLAEVAGCGDVALLEGTVIDFLERLGLRHFACVSHMDRLHQPPGTVDLHNYPKEWEIRFAERHLEKIDPVQRYARTTILPFRWNDPDFLQTLTRDQLLILQEAAVYGLKHGATVPLHGPGRMSASFSASTDGGRIDQQTLLTLQLVAPFVFERALALGTPGDGRAKSGKRLTPREKECLALAAGGKSSWAIGEILSISETTVQFHLENVKRRFGVATRAQAIMAALHDAQLSFDDIRWVEDNLL